METVWEYLAVEPEETAVLSAILDMEGEPSLMAASLLIGPEAIAAGWPAWRLAEGFKPQPSEDLTDLPGEFMVEGEGFVAGRVVMSVEEARGWASSALESGVAPAVGDLPQAHASFEVARAPIRVRTHSETEAGNLATWLARPVIGFHFPRGEDKDEPKPGAKWTIGATELFSPAIDVLGMSWFEEKKGSPPTGLLLGRFERRAWLVSQKLEPDKELYRVEIGLDPSRAELIDLEIEVEESVGAELVFAEHLRLEDTGLAEVEQALYGPAPTEGRLEIGVALPTLGRGVRRSVRLTHRDGELLDSWESFNIVEAISFTMTVDGAEGLTQTIGETRAAQELVELQGAVERVRSQYAGLRRGGAENRLFDDPAEAAKVLRAVLERAPGELLVLDPFFNSWSTLLDLPGPPPRVLIGPSAKAPPVEFDGKARRWSGALAPFHDRFFLWEGGGLSTGTSPGSQTTRLFRMARIGASEAAVLRERFALWWSDPGFEAVEVGAEEAPERPAGLTARQEVIRQETQATLHERAQEGGGCAYVSLTEYVERFKVSESEILRDISHLLETEHLEEITVEISK